MAAILSTAQTFAERFTNGQGPYPLRPDLRILHHLADRCHQRSSLLDSTASGCSAALIALSAHWRDWLRPLDEWQPLDGEANEQFGSLLRHLFARYEVPAFLDAGWRLGPATEAFTSQNWFKHIGSGQSIRTAEGLPIPFTKRMAHHFVQAPGDFGILQAVRYAQVVGLGGSERLVRSLLGTRLGTDFHANDFWATVIRWLIVHADVKPEQHGPIVDYLHHQKFVPSLGPGLERGLPRLTTARSNLCMKGRTVTSLFRAIEQWHKQLGAHRGPFAFWNPSGFPPFQLVEGEGPTRKVCTITELISTSELEEEGQAMNHCVASYRAMCQAGQSSIWSMTVEDSIKPDRSDADDRSPTAGAGRSSRRGEWATGPPTPASCGSWRCGPERAARHCRRRGLDGSEDEEALLSSKAGPFVFLAPVYFAVERS